MSKLNEYDGELVEVVISNAIRVLVFIITFIL